MGDNQIVDPSDPQERRVSGGESSVGAQGGNPALALGSTDSHLPKSATRVDPAWIAEVQAIVDRAHAENWGGSHCSGFCKACSDAYIVAQYAVPHIEEGRSYDAHRQRVLDYETDDEALAGECARYGLYVSLRALLRHLYGNYAATMGAKDSTIRILEERATDGK